MTSYQSKPALASPVWFGVLMFPKAFCRTYLGQSQRRLRYLNENDAERMNSSQMQWCKQAGQPAAINNAIMPNLRAMFVTFHLELIEDGGAFHRVLG